MVRRAVRRRPPRRRFRPRPTNGRLRLRRARERPLDARRDQPAARVPAEAASSRTRRADSGRTSGARGLLRRMRAGAGPLHRQGSDPRVGQCGGRPPARGYDNLHSRGGTRLLHRHERSVVFEAWLDDENLERTGCGRARVRTSSDRRGDTSLLCCGGHGLPPLCPSERRCRSGSEKSWARRIH